MFKQIIPTFVTIIFSIGAAGCVDLTAVSDFTKLGSDIASDTAALDGYPAAVKYAARFNPNPTERAKLEGQLPAAQTETKSADLGTKTLSLYLSTVSSLAADKTVDVSASATSIATSLKTLGTLTAATQKPATNLIGLMLGGVLDGWRREKVAALIVDADPSVQELCTALAAFATLTAQRYALDESQVKIYYADLGTKEDPAVRELLGEWRDSHMADFGKAAAAATTAAQAFAKIAAGHAALKANASNLSTKELQALMAKYQDQLTTAAQALAGS